LTERLPSTSAIRHTILWCAGLAYAGFLAFVVFWPSPIDAPIQGLLERAIQEMHERGVPAFVDYAFIEFMSNVVLFVPVGIIFGLLLPIRFWAIALMLGPLLSLGIEMAQKLLLADRYSSIYDIIANSVGATLGVMVATVLRAAVHARDEKVILRHEALQRRAAAIGSR